MKHVITDSFRVNGDTLFSSHLIWPGGRGQVFVPHLIGTNPGIKVSYEPFPGVDPVPLPAVPEVIAEPGIWRFWAAPGSKINFLVEPAVGDETTGSIFVMDSY